MVAWKPASIRRRGTKNERSLLVAVEARRLHAERAKPFNAETHGHLLRQIWAQLQPEEEYVASGPGWKEIGFQGNDPTTDVRAGGLLAVQMLHQFVLLHEAGTRHMIKAVEEASAANPDRYYPPCAVGVVACSLLCDELGLSDGMRGAIKEDALEELLKSPLKSPLARYLLGSYSQVNNSAAQSRKHVGVVGAPGGGGRNRPLAAQMQGQRQGGFAKLFALLTADFHCRFIIEGGTYMGSQALLKECLERLKTRAQELSDQHGSDEQLWRLYLDDAMMPGAIASVLTEPRVRLAQRGRPKDTMPPPSLCSRSRKSSFAVLSRKSSLAVLSRKSSLPQHPTSSVCSPAVASGVHVCALRTAIAMLK